MATKAGPGTPFACHRISEYERCLLGAYIRGADIGAGVNSAVFASGAHKSTFQVIKELKALGVEADLITLVSELEKRKQLDTAGGAGYVAALTNTVLSTTNMGFYEAEVLAARPVPGCVESGDSGQGSSGAGRSPGRGTDKTG
jgi:replicative DNA helicase